MVKINFECTISGEKLSGSFITDDESGASFLLSKHKEERIIEAIEDNIKITSYSYERY